MSSSNQWFGKLVSRAKSVQEQAKNGIEKLSVTLDKKIKEAQEDLEKYEILLIFIQTTFVGSGNSTTTLATINRKPGW